MLELITAALLAGTTAGITSVAGDAIKDAYTGLKDVLVRKFGKTKGAIDALEDDPKDEDAQKLVTKRLSEANAAADAEVKAQTDKLVAALKAAGITVGTGAITQTATGDGNVQIGGGMGSGNTVTSNVSKDNSGVTVQGSTVHGDIIKGDKVGGDKIGTQVNHYGRMPGADFDTAVSPLGQKLAHVLTTRFSLPELNGLCFTLGVNKDEVSGETLTERAQALVLLYERRKHIAALRQAMSDAREDLRNEL